MSFLTGKQTTDTEEKRSLIASLAQRKGLLWGIGGVVCALVIAYLVGVHHFSTHFVPGTTVGGIDASWLTADELSQKVAAEIPAYSTHVTGDGFDLTVSASDVALSVDSDTYAQQALEEFDERMWPIDALSKRSVNPQLGVTYDQALLDEFVWQQVSAFNESAEQPTNASASYDAEAGKFTTVPESVGTALDGSVVIDEVGKSLLALDDSTKLKLSALAQPTVHEDDAELTSSIDYVNQAISSPLRLLRDGQEIAVIDKDLSSQWATVVTDDTGTHVSFNREAVQQWIYDNLSAQLTGSDEVNDWALDADALASSICAKLLEANGGDIEVPIVFTQVRPPESEGARERGRHIDVNLSNQYARFYDENGNVLWRSYIVSANTSAGHVTPTGEFYINSMEQGVVLEGLNDGVVLEPGQEPGPGDLYQSYVNYWMCFLGNSYGLHDATWRSLDEFGGDTYQWNGSHGCVNLPYAEAEQLYNLIHVGDMVYIHW